MRKISRVLLIDDDDVNNYINQKLLERLAITDEIVVLMNGKEGIEYVKEKCLQESKIFPGLVLLDHHMPIMDGVEFMKAFNELKISNRSEIIFILLGANSTEADIEIFKKLGVEEFTNKPLSDKVVMDAYYKYWGEKN